MENLTKRDGQCPMDSKKNLVEPRYTLAVNSLDKSTEYYTTLLGFVVVAEYPGWAFLKRDSVILMLGECVDEAPASKIGDHSYFGYIEVRDAKVLFDEFALKGVEFMKQLVDEPWGMREFGIRTIDGHRIMFGQDLDA